MSLCILSEMDFGILEWAVLGNVLLLIILLVVLFYTICRLRKATLKNKLEETLPQSETSDLVPQRYSTLCGLKSGNTRQNGISVLANEDFRRYEKARMSNFHLEKNSTPIITMSPASGPPAYLSATLPLPGKKSGVTSQMKVPVQWTPPPSYWIALPPTMPHPSTTFQYAGPYTTLPTVLKKHQRCRHEQLRHNGYRQAPVTGTGRRAIESSFPAQHCMIVHNCGKKVQMQEDI